MRSEFELRHFVVGTQGTHQRKLWRALDARKGCTETESHILSRIIEELNAAAPFSFTAFDAEEPRYWSETLNRRAQQELTAFGRVTVETQEKLFQIGEPLPCGRDYLRDIENRMLEGCQAKILIATPTFCTPGEIDAGKLDHLYKFKSTKEVTFAGRFTINGADPDVAYTEAARKAKDIGAQFLLTIEDDHEIQPDTFLKLWELYRKAGPKAIVGAWYPRRQPGRVGCPIVARDGKREALADDGSVHEVYVIPMGFTLIPVKVFYDLPQPWFCQTPMLTQDAFFSQIAREAGYHLLVDTSARIAHIDRKTGERYE